MRAVLRLYAFSVIFCKFNGIADEGKNSVYVCVIEQVEEAWWYMCMDIPFPSTTLHSVGIPKTWESVRKGGKGKGNGLEASCGKGELPSTVVSHLLLAPRQQAGVLASCAHIWPGRQYVGIACASGSHHLGLFCWYVYIQHLQVHG